MNTSLGTRPEPGDAQTRLVLVTGPSGAGRTTAVRALEDLGHEVIDNLPLSLLPRLLDGPPLARPLALGIGVTNRDFTTDAMIEAIDLLAARADVGLSVVYLDCGEDELVRRYGETRRRHPLSPDGSPLSGIRRERELLVPIRARADILIATDGLTLHDLKGEVMTHFAPGGILPMTIALHSFSYKRGLPRGLDMVIDCRFLRNPHWHPDLRDIDGRETAVQGFVASDPRFGPFVERLRALLDIVLPAAREEGKAHLAIGFGCTGGQHRSVTVAEVLAAALALDGWPVSKRHRELERRDATGAAPGSGQDASERDSQR